MHLSWNGPDPKDKSACPYPVNFYCRPAPAESLNSLESGRLLLRVHLGNGVKSVSGQLVNNAKKENLDKTSQESDTSKIKSQTLLSTTLVQDAHQPSSWVGELSIPASWVEGRTRTHERTGSASPKNSGTNLYTLEITYMLDNGNVCTALFNSDDAFHWEGNPKEPIS